ncbi:MAG: hypothetical protein HY231_13980 [Acidobacteria bacterium]|nr:hypothetical protein [Acidobacteriota bacterium]
MFFIIGIHFFVWGQERAAQAMHCTNCGIVAPFLVRKGRQFITLFFIIPILPISGVKHILQCPNCRTRFQGA